MDDKPDTPSPPPDEEEQPVGDLALMNMEVPEGFWTRVHRKIDRRVATAQVMSFSWNLPKVIFIEFLQIAFNVFTPAKSRKGESR
jgi:hypothetical protein